VNSISFMNAISAKFEQPWLLLLIIPAAFVMLFPYFRLKKQHRRTASRITSLVLHSVIILLCGFMVSGLTFDYSHAAVKSDVIILVDASDSAKPSKARMDEFIRSVADNLEDGYRLGVIKFAGGQLYVSELDGNADKVYDKYIKADNVSDGSSTDIASALYFAREMLKSPKSGRIIVLSDGRQTDGNALAAVKAVADGGTRVDSVYFSQDTASAEVQINSVEVPSAVAVGETVPVTVTVQSASVCNATLYLYDNGEKYAEREVSLGGGETSFVFDYSLLSPKLHEFKVEIITENDTVTQNNVYYSYVSIDSSKRVLIISAKDGDSAKLKEILDENYDVTATTTAQLPMGVAELTAYDEVILSNVANSDLPAEFTAALTEYVEIYGGGLYTAGGDRAYKEADMADSQLQELLPVEANTDAKSLGLLLVIDSSGSMRETAEGTSSTRMELAIDAAIASVNALAPDDYMGVISFNAKATVEVDMTQITNKTTIINKIKRIQTDTGTVYSYALNRARTMLTSFSHTELKHVIFLTDGEPVDGRPEYPNSNMSIIMNEVDRMASSKITVSTIALGASVPVDTAKEMAERGNGRFYDVKRERELSKIMVEETTVAAGKYENAEEFKPTVNSHTAAVAGIADDEIPMLGGFYGTRIKDDATMVLGHNGNPIYAEWKRGEGKVGSFMSDLIGNWSEGFLSDPVGVRFVLNSVSSLFPIVRTDEYADIRAEFVRDNYTTEIRIHADSAVTAAVTFGGQRADIPLTKVSDEMYAGRFDTKTSGVYTVNIEKTDGSGSLTAHTAVSYSEEYRAFGDDTQSFTFMESLSENGGGQVLFSTENMFGKKNEVESGSFDPRLTFLIITVVLFLADIVVRKFKLDRLIEIIKEKRQKKNEAK